MPKTSDQRPPGSVVKLKPSTYQPSKAELEEPIQIDVTPEELARAVVRPVNVVYDED